MTAIVTVSGLTKVFDLHRKKRRAGVSAMQLQALRPLLRYVIRGAGRAKRPLVSLDDVGFEVGAGEILGIVGRNGAGKSTLLKILARVLEPTAGRVELRGRVASLLELGAGLSGDLTVEENVDLQIALSGEEVSDELKDAIIAMAGLEDYRDEELDECPGGSVTRLSFATLISINSDIVLADEILAIGNERFKAMVLERIRNVSAEGGAVLFVSHDLEAVRGLCHRVLWLHQGRIRMIGPPAETVAAYEAAFFAPAEEEADGSEVCRLVGFRLLSEQDVEIGAVTSDRPAVFEAVVQHLRPDIPLRVSIVIAAGARGAPLLETRLAPDLKGTAPRTVRATMTLPRGTLAEGSYRARLFVRWNVPDRPPAALDQPVEFRVFDAGEAGASARRKSAARGLVELDLPWRLKKVPASREVSHAG